MKKHSFIVKAVVIACISMLAVSAASAKGRKYGLFIGINAYSGGINPLKGAVNDATKMRQAMITKFGFSAADTTLLTDSAATREAILSDLLKYQAAAGAGDLLVVHYSGHGTLFPDAYSEEQDETKLIYMEAPNEAGQMEVIYERGAYDSAIVPFDARSTSSGKPWRNLIIDDEFYAIFSAVTRNGAQVVLISDSCHSGTIDRAQTPKDARRKMQPLATVFGVRSFSDIKLQKLTLTRSRKTPPPVKGLYISMTGSRDDEFSLDVPLKDGSTMGLFTFALLLSMPRVVNPMQPMSYEALMNAVAPAVADLAMKNWQNNQHPQLNIEFGNPKMAIFSPPPGM